MGVAVAIVLALVLMFTIIYFTETLIDSRDYHSCKFNRKHKWRFYVSEEEGQYIKYCPVCEIEVELTKRELDKELWKQGLNKRGL